jgi:DNA-directed RNA polymerase specialized sigma24 family protein
MTAFEPEVSTRMPLSRQRRIEQLYEDVFPIVARFVASRGGSFDDARDIFHDSLVILYEKVEENKFSPGTSEDRYLAGIAKHLWLRKFKEDINKIGLDDMERRITVPEDYFDSSDNRLVALLELSGKKCLKLLRAFFYDNLAIPDIKEMFGFSSVHSTSAQKFKCIEKVRATVQQKSLNYEDFA